MQAKFLIATTLIVLFALVSSKWAWVEDHQSLGATGLGRPPRDLPEGNTLQAVKEDRVVNSLAYEEAEVLQQQGSLSANHQEAKDADALLNALIKRLTQQIADDTAATNQKISDRTNSIKKFDDAVNAAKALLDDLTNQQTALNRKIDEAKTALASRQGEKTAEQAAIDKENAEQRARLADRIAAVEKQIALIKQILILLSGQAPNPQIPSDSIILDTDGENAVAALLKGTKYEGKKFQRIFIASQNGYEGAKYIAACRDKPALLTIIKATNGNVFGGFNSFALDGSWTWKVDADAFIFSYKRGSETKMVKMAPTPNNDNRVSYLGHVNFGPVFGADDLFTSDRCNANTNSMSMLGRAFQSPDGKVVSPNNVVYSNYIAGVQNWQCAEYEVYQLV